MGYELTFHYHEKDEEGKFNLQSEENIKEFSRNVGRRNSEISLEQVAAVIMGQLARRDVYITKVEVYEYAKREVSFKETKNGVVIKGRKFSFDQLHGVLKADDDCGGDPAQQEAPMPELRRESGPVDMTEFMPDLSQFRASLPPPEHPGVLPQMPQFNPALARMTAQKPKHDPNIPARYETYAPCQEDYIVYQKEGVKLTRGKDYPIFGEVIKQVSGAYGGPLLHYSIQDDAGQRIWINSNVFEPIRRPLVGETEQQAPRPPEGRLAYVDYGSGVVSRGGISQSSGGGGGGDIPPMPTIRRDY